MQMQKQIYRNTILVFVGFRICIFIQNTTKQKHINTKYKIYKHYNTKYEKKEHHQKSQSYMSQPNAQQRNIF